MVHTALTNQAFCPKCGAVRSALEAECAHCGVVFEKYQVRHHSKSLRTTVPPDLARVWDPEAQKALFIGAGLSIFAFSFGWCRYIMSFFSTLVHEMGHAGAYWLFGYPAVPAFDFIYGGGITLNYERNFWLILIGPLLGLIPFWVFRCAPLFLRVWAICYITYILLALTPLHELFALFMGHGAELGFSILCFYRVLTGRGLNIAVERPFYAFLGFFLLGQNTWISFQLLWSQSFRASYEKAKGGGSWMDFSRIANDYFSGDLPLVCSFFLLTCFLVFPCAYYLFFKKRELDSIGAQLRQLFLKEK